jgi:hypothetical protein
MSKSNQAANRVTLADSSLAGYNGPLDIVRLRRPWWRRVLRLPAVAHYQRVHGDIRTDSARVWQR